MCPPEVGIQSTGRAAPGQREAGRDTEKQKGPGGQRHVVSQQHLTQGLVSSLRGRVGGWLQAGPARGPRRPQGPAALPSSFSFTLPDPPEPLPPLSLILTFKCPATAVRFKAEVRSCRTLPVASVHHRCRVLSWGPWPPPPTTEMPGASRVNCYEAESTHPLSVWST